MAEHVITDAAPPALVAMAAEPQAVLVLLAEPADGD